MIHRTHFAFSDLTSLTLSSLFDVQHKICMEPICYNHTIKGNPFKFLHHSLFKKSFEKIYINNNIK